ncbi:hypothetical protein [Streptomyces acidiscabies]|nr:hypothetical protein [Streptomyces acidiscabies]
MPTPTQATESSIARRVTDWPEPRTWIILNPLVIGWHSSRWTSIA